jgi:hypothetical protein
MIDKIKIKNDKLDSSDITITKLYDAFELEITNDGVTRYNYISFEDANSISKFLLLN